jgi:ferrous iron transport protein B
VKEIKVALVGNPNCGKTSLFNTLTGLNQKVSNFPGTTVDKKVGHFTIDAEHKVKIIDLPGTYSLYPKSDDEAVTFYGLCSHENKDIPDVVLFIADASNLKRNLLLFTQVADLGYPVVFALNMIDLADRKGIEYNYGLLQSRLGVEIIPTNARKMKGLDRIKQAILSAHRSSTAPFFETTGLNQSMLEECKTYLSLNNSYSAVLWAHNQMLLFKDGEQLKKFKEILARNLFCEKKEQVEEIVARYRMIDIILKETSKRKASRNQISLSNRLDTIITHKYFGLSFFLLVLFVIFQAIFSLASYPMEWMEVGMNYFSNEVEHIIPGGTLNNLIVHGILAGLSGVIVFIPQIAILFFFITLLEDIGYMARVSFIMDKLMRSFGLNGKSVVPLISGMACAVPAIMSARNIENKQEKLITIMVIPLMSCSARLPVYTLLISMLVPETYLWGFLNMQGLILMGMYVLGFVTSLLSAWVFQKILKPAGNNYFIMEMPAFKIPMWRNVFLTIYEKCRSFVFEAGKIIVAISILLWALSSFAPAGEFEKLDAKYKELASAPTKSAEVLAAEYQSEKLEASYAGYFGKMIEPAIAPLGFNWKIGIALITSFAAREVFVGTMTTIYSASGDESDFSSIRLKMIEEINPLTHQPQYSLAVIASLLIFYAFAMQCMSTLAITYRETKSLKWTLLQLFYLTALAYLSSLLVFNFLK